MYAAFEYGKESGTAHSIWDEKFRQGAIEHNGLYTISLM